ncbi:hypothetical protein AVEN_87955-1 [Araneus ventricosus]|uniref:Uncharacterized protein n=1 Tax=Araneus ventricosus TaxID=182803 RepID=A0A4Y2NF04_ARAVE|nr:hypothetical protein AVEN_87955-1 [Araneus ventricosus]
MRRELQNLLEMCWCLSISVTRAPEVSPGGELDGERYSVIARIYWMKDVLLVYLEYVIVMVNKSNDVTDFTSQSFVFYYAFTPGDEVCWQRSA